MSSRDTNKFQRVLGVTTEGVSTVILRGGATKESLELAVSRRVRAICSLRCVTPQSLEHNGYSFLGKPCGNEQIATNAAWDIFESGSRAAIAISVLVKKSPWQ